MDIPWRSFSLRVIRINIYCFFLFWDTFGTQSFFILPSCGTLEHTHSYAPSSLPNVYFLLLTLNMINILMYVLFYLELTGQSLLRDEQCCSPSACKCSPPSGPAWSGSWNAWLKISWSILSLPWVLINLQRSNITLLHTVSIGEIQSQHQGRI